MFSSFLGTLSRASSEPKINERVVKCEERRAEIVCKAKHGGGHMVKELGTALKRVHHRTLGGIQVCAMVGRTLLTVSGLVGCVLECGQ